MTMKAGDCTTMDDIRANIDRIDADLIQHAIAYEKGQLGED